MCKEASKLNVVALQNNLSSLTDNVFPGVNEMFSDPDRADGSQKRVDFIMTFWHYELHRPDQRGRFHGAVPLMAEIGDVRRFPRRSSIVSFADVDPAVDESGKPYFVYMTAVQNKFLRIYYARVVQF